MPKKLKTIVNRDFSGGHMRAVQPALVPRNTYRLGLNLDSDKIIGALTIRKGTSIIGKQAVASAACLGLYQHFETSGTNCV